MKIIDRYKEEIEKEEAAGKEIICAYCDNETKSLNYIIDELSKVELLDITSKDGRRCYQRGILYIMCMAFNEVYPEAYITIDYQLTNAMFVKLDNMEITEEMLENVRNKMQEIIDNNYEIKKVTMTKEEAAAFYEKNKTLRGIAQLDNKQKDDVSLYYCQDYFNYFYGVMPISTGYTKYFDLMKYKNGFLIRYPGVKDGKEIKPYKETKKLLSALQEYDDIYKALDINTVYKLNKMITSGRTSELILYSEALQEKKIANIADMIAQRPNVKMVLIAGPSSSGKTTFSKRLGVELRLNGMKPVTISVDNYFVERPDTPRDENGNYDFESLYAIDLDLFNRHINSLLNGEEIDVPTFDFKEGTKKYNGEKMRLHDDEILVIEGIHCLNDKLTELVPLDRKFKIYISDLTVLNIDYFNRISTTDTRLIRRIVRDYKFRGYSALHTLATWQSVNDGEAKNIFPYQENADVMFNSSIVYELSVLKQYALPLLEEITNDCVEYSDAKRLSSFLKYFEAIPTENIPKNSLLREFIGGSVFKY